MSPDTVVCVETYALFSLSLSSRVSFFSFFCVLVDQKEEVFSLSLRRSCIGLVRVQALALGEFPTRVAVRSGFFRSKGYMCVGDFCESILLACRLSVAEDCIVSLAFPRELDAR